MISKTHFITTAITLCLLVSNSYAKEKTDTTTEAPIKKPMITTSGEAAKQYQNPANRSNNNLNIPIKAATKVPAEKPMIKASDEAAKQYKNQRKGSQSDFSLEAYEKAAKASVQLLGTSDESQVSGKFKFVETPQGLILHGNLENIPEPGDHGFHIHENGSCDDGGKGAGGHYNPRGHDHGNLIDNGLDAAHVGDLGNVKINDDGKGSINVILPELRLSGESDLNVTGKAIILHAKADDFGQPTGNAGGRIGCGIITIMENKPPVKKASEKK